MGKDSTMNILTLKFLIVLLLSSFYNLSFGQESNCASLIPEDSNFGYKQHSNRCEGFYNPQLSGNLQVVSFIMGGEVKFTWDEKTLLAVSRIDKSEFPINIRAVSLQRNVFYRMDAVLAGDDSLDWPIAPYIYHRNIKPDQLGVYGWSGEEYDKVSSPVIVKQKDGTVSHEQILILKICTVLDLTHFRWNLMHLSGPICGTDAAIDQFQTFEGDMTAGSIIEINFPDMDEDEGTFCLEIQYRPENKRWRSEILKIRM